MASRQPNTSAETSKKSPQKKSPQLKSKNASVDKLTSHVDGMSLDDVQRPSSKRTMSSAAAAETQQQQRKSQGITESPSSSGRLKKAGSMGSMSDNSTSSDLKLPRDFKKEKRASVAEVPMREEAAAAAAVAEDDVDDEDAAALEWFINEEYLKEVDKDSKPEDKQHRRELADNLKMEGNDLYKKNEYADAARMYTAALRTLPLSYGNERAILYSNRAACFLYMNELDEGIHDCTKALEINPNYLKAILRRAQLYEKMEKLDEALTDYRKVRELEPKDPKAVEACMRLPEEIRDRNEKLKTEMLGKLKDLGNMILKPFGLSTENFKVQQDPSSGSYSINLQQNK